MRPGIPPMRNSDFQPKIGTSNVPIWPVTISPTGKIISYSMKIAAATLARAKAR